MARKILETPMEENLDRPVHEILQTMQDGILRKTSWMGVRAYKCPLDAWVYQEIIFETIPKIIIEIGTKFGGSALYLANLCDLMNVGRVISVDIDQSRVYPQVLDHPLVTLVAGDAVKAFPMVRDMLFHDDNVLDRPLRTLIIEDSAHTYENTLAVLETYSRIQNPGDYFIVEDSIANHGLDRQNKWPRGPYEAIEDFLKENDKYISDREREHFFLTWNPKGFLKRVK